jgi:hypothetical protein
VRGDAGEDRLEGPPGHLGERDARHQPGYG